MSDRYAVFGNPVGHSKSPRIHALFAAQTGQDLTYEALLAPLDGFAACVQGFISEGGRGANVTVPFKEQAFRLATQLTPRAQAAGAANTLSFRGDDIIGDNTDGAGLVRDITTHCGRAIAGKRVLLLGAGGAARGCLLPLLETGPAQLSIANRTRARADAMVREVGAGEMKWPAWGTASGIREAPLRADASPELCKAEGGAAQGPASGLMVCCFEELTAQGSFDIVINATSAGLDDSGLAIPDSVFAAHTLAYDMLYGRETPFMMQARCAGARVADGLGMLVEQAAEAFFVWRGIHPDTASVLAALRAA